MAQADVRVLDSATVLPRSASRQAGTGRPPEPLDDGPEWLTVVMPVLVGLGIGLTIVADIHLVYCLLA